MSFTVTSVSGSRFDGQATFPGRFLQSSRRGEFPWSPVKFRGTYDSSSRSWSIVFDAALILLEGRLERRVTLRAQVVPENGYLVGTLDYPGCVDVVLVPESAGATNLLAFEWAQRQKRAAASSGVQSPRTAPSGPFDGIYECFETQYRVSVDFTQTGPSAVSGSLQLPDQPVPPGRRRPTAPVRVSGQFVDDSELTFESGEAVYLHRNIREPLRVKARFNHENGYLIGEVAREGCSTFVAAPAGIRTEDLQAFIARTITPGRVLARMEADYEAKIRSGYVPTELRPGRGAVYGQPYLKYVDRAIERGGQLATVQGKRDMLVSVASDLEKEGLTCVMESEATWSGVTGRAAARLRGLTQFVVACLENCDELKYWPVGLPEQQMSHSGTTLDYPVAALNTAQLLRAGYPAPAVDFQWEFRTAAASGKKPQVIVTSWQPAIPTLLLGGGASCPRSTRR